MSINYFTKSRQADIFATDLIYRLLSKQVMYSNAELYKESLTFNKDKFDEGEKLIEKIGGIRLLVYGNLNDAEKAEFFPNGDPKLSQDLESAIMTFNSFELTDGIGMVYAESQE